MSDLQDHSYSHYDHISLRMEGDEYVSHDPESPTDKDFKLYTMDLSYFSGKLEMYLRYKEISHLRIEPTAREFTDILFRNTGSEQVPQLYDARPHIEPQHRWLRDTTPIIQYLEKDQCIAMTSRPVIMQCQVQAFFQLLLEDYADEFLWRPAMWWRWEPSFDRFIMGYRFTYEFAREPQERYTCPRFLRPALISLRQWLLSCKGEDVITQKKMNIIKEQYYELLDILQEILSDQPFLFGSHPTFVDFGFAGPFFRHFSSDFTPRKVMQLRAPAVYQWIAVLWNCRSSTVQEPNGFPVAGTLPSNWHRLLQLLPDFLEYYHLNAKAFSEKKGHFDWKYKNEMFRVPAVHYRAWCRQKLQLAFNELDDVSKRSAEAMLRQYYCWDLLWKDGIIEVPPELGIEPPFSIFPPPERTKVHLYKWDFRPIFNAYLAKHTLRLVICAAIGASFWWKLGKRGRVY